MRALWKNFWSLTALLLALATGRAADCPLTFPVADAGWYTAGNYHDPENVNYIVGYHGAGATELRNFFVFDLPALNGVVAGAQLRIFTFTISTPQAAETYELHDITTPLATLLAGAGAGVTNVFNDLGSGLLYGARAITNSQGDSYTTMTLNSNAVAAINAADGQPFALGGRVSTLAAVPGADEKLFGFSFGAAPYVELTVTFANAGAPYFYEQLPTVGDLWSSTPLVLSASACGADPLSYRWYSNNVALNQTNRTITLNNPWVANGSVYFVVASNVFGSATSSPALLLGNASAPQIEFFEATQKVAVGFTAGFYPSVSGNPAPSLQWFFAGLEIPGATNFYYEILNAQLFHSATLSLVASNLLGVVTNEVVLQVEPMLLYGPFAQETITGEAGYMSIQTLSSVPVTYQWRFNGTNLPGATGRTLTIGSVPPGFTFPYEVVVANAYGARTSAVASILGIIPNPPVVAYAPAVSLPNPPLFGRDTLLRAQATGIAPLNYQWFFNGQPVTGATNSDLVLVNYATNQRGAYSYLVTNDWGGAVSPGLSLNGVFQAAVLQPANSSRDVFTGQPLGLQARALGGPPPRLQWQRNGTNLPGATNFSLLFTSAQPADSGFYVLYATNLVSSTSIGFSLNVQPRRALDRWSWRNAQPQANDLPRLAHGNGRIVAGGEGGSFIASTNGTNWITTALGRQFEIERLVFGNGLFVALAADAEEPDLLFLSTDGVNWQPRALPISATYWHTLDFVNGEFFITGYDGSTPLQLLRSTDAQTWTKQTVPSLMTGLVAGLAYGNGRYVLASQNEILVSADAVNWQRHFAPMYPSRVFFANGTFVVTTYYGEPWFSTDGRVWNERNTGLSTEPYNTSPLQSVAGGQGQFIAVGLNGLLLRSANGNAWTAVNATTTRDLRDVIFTGTQWVVCGNDGVLLTSPNGVTWTDRRGGRTRDLYGIIYTNGQFVAVGYEGTVLTSPDALTWTARTSGTTHDLHTVLYANGMFMAGGRKGTVITSPNAINWTVRATPTTNYIERIAWGAGRFVAAATHGTILSSTNGIIWEQHTNPVEAETEFEGVAYGGGRFVMVGGYFYGSAHSRMLVSSNGVDWANTSVEVGKGLRGVEYGGGRFLAVGNDGAVIFSTNGLAWNGAELVTPFLNWRHPRHALGRFVVVGNAGALATYNTSILSPEFGWHPHATIVSQNLHDIAYGAGKFVAVGNAGTIVQSEFAAPHFSTPQFTNGVTTFRLTGGLEAEYRVESSLFLNAWQTVGNYTNDGHGVTFTNTGNPFQGFYRAVHP